MSAPESTKLFETDAVTSAANWRISISEETSVLSNSCPASVNGPVTRTIKAGSSFSETIRRRTTSHATRTFPFFVRMSGEFNISCSSSVLINFSRARLHEPSAFHWRLHPKASASRKGSKKQVTASTFKVLRIWRAAFAIFVGLE